MAKGRRTGYYRRGCLPSISQTDKPLAEVCPCGYQDLFFVSWVTIHNLHLYLTVAASWIAVLRFAGLFPTGKLEQILIPILRE